ncbi:histone H3 K4-specific methyltransferase SET7/9 family protein [Rhynchospora pubera]|uniref:Histone H3 K4-specific methyltransferase SET7/9 family protein n=1 Tax=Rhynchospora pubera TaxID=906938 RepID=A0AAV8EEE7_9POAL|nr:histone H3 K4-specific methyltransferase SET7/9 family protein [Rhynchospora pubera]
MHQQHLHHPPTFSRPDHHHHHPHHYLRTNPHQPPLGLDAAPSSSSPLHSAPIHPPPFIRIDIPPDPNPIPSPSPSSHAHGSLLSTPHKRPLVTSSPTSTPSSSSSRPLPFSPPPSHNRRRTGLSLRRLPCSSALALRRLLRRLHFRLRILLLLSFPSLYLFFSSTSYSSTRSFLLDFLSAAAFSTVLLLLLLLFSFHPCPLRSFKSLFPYGTRPRVFWSIGSANGSNPTSARRKRSKSGFFVQVYSNGDVYEGEFQRGKLSGSGVYYYYMSGRYEGDWVDEKYDGYGVETWARGSRYRGQFRQGLRHGYGVYRFYTGDVYSGEWHNGQSHGYGMHTCEDGSRYVGEFKWGVKHGLGHYHFRNGDMYAGEYFADKMHGFGVYNFAHGHRYEGSWHEGKRQGLGMYSFRNGETQSGHWQSGVLDTLSTQNTVPASPVAVNHSKVLNAVQEARRAAQKAYDVPRVDSKVNSAVVAANKSANAARVAAVKAVQGSKMNTL